MLNSFHFRVLAEEYPPWPQQSETIESQIISCPNPPPGSRDWTRSPGAVFQRADRHWWQGQPALARPSLQWNFWSGESSSTMNQASLWPLRKMPRSWRRTLLPLDLTCTIWPEKISWLWITSGWSAPRSRRPGITTWRGCSSALDMPLIPSVRSGSPWIRSKSFLEPFPTRAS